MAGKWNTKVYAGRRWYRVLTVADLDSQPVPWAGYEAGLMMRDANDALLLELATGVDLDDPENTKGLITLHDTDGTITLDVPPAITSTLDGIGGLHVFDLALTDPEGNLQEPLVEGTVRFKRAATRVIED